MSNYDAWELCQHMCEVFGYKYVLNELMCAMSTDELRDMFEFIARNNEIDIRPYTYDD